MTLYVLFHCDEWHTYSSFRFIGVVEKEQLQDALNKIKKEQGYSDQDVKDYIHITETYLNDLEI
jgi:hypothetical protein